MNTVIIASYHMLQTQQKQKSKTKQIIILVLRGFQFFIYV